MGQMKSQAKKWGKNHMLALELWPTELYEARIVAAHIADPKQVDCQLMDAWTEDFDNWAICDTCCLTLFCKAPPRWEKVAVYAGREEEFVKRPAFALIWSMTRHDKAADDSTFTATFPLLEEAAKDPRPLVSKAADMALRAIGKRNAALNRPASQFSARLSASDHKHVSKVGRKCWKELQSEKVLSRLR